MTPSLLLSPRYTDDARLVRQAALEAGWRVVRPGKWGLPDPLPPAPHVVYGETLLGRLLADALGLVMPDPDPGWLPGLPLEWRRRIIHQMTLGEARRLTGSFFLKPVEDKTFRAGVVPSGADIPADIADTEQVFIAEPVEWLWECRCFLKDGVVRATSRYEGEDAPHQQEMAAELAAVVAAASDLPRGIVIDVGWIKDRGLAVVESNPAWASGIYGCHPPDVLPVIAAACGLDWEPSRSASS